MTNGEKMQEVFPEGKTRRCKDGVVFESDGWCHAYGSDWWSAEYKEPTTKNNLGVDCIDRAQAQTEIEMNASRYTLAHERGTRGDVEWSDNLIAIDDAVDIIRNLPSVTPQEPRKGHWVIKDKMWWVCSACGCQTRMMKKYNVPNFCPACGADMREVEE